MRWEQLGVIKRADREVDAVTGRVIVKQRCAAIAAIAAVDMFGTAEAGGRATGTGDGLSRGCYECGEDVADGLLAHAAVADVGVVQHFGRVITHGAALAATADLHGVAVHQPSSLGGQSSVS